MQRIIVVQCNSTAAASYNSRHCTIQDTQDIMEAEQLNAISSKLDDLAQRADELRRYL